MEDNIEVKDVQRTEYLDKTGLDMLWTKIKENTHNQVEVERNRAVAKENSIVNSINNEFVSKTTTDDQTINSSLLINNNVLEIIGRLVDRSSAGLSLDSTARYLRITSSGITCNGGTNSSGDGLFFEANGRLSDIYHTSDQMIVRQFDSLNTEVSDHGVFVGNNTADGPRGIQITGNGIQIEEATQVPVNRSSDKVFATDGSIANLTEYIKIASNITTGGFGAVRTVDTINNNIGVGDNRSQLAYIGKGELGVISYNNDGYATESFRYTTTYGFEMTNNRGYKSVKIPCDSNEVTVYKPGTNSYNTRYGYYGVTLGENHDDNNLLNTNGSYKTIGTDIVPLENGKVPEEYLDLSQYAKKSEITAGGNVNDVQINGVSVVENKIANIKPATKEKLGVVKVGNGLNVTDGVISVAPDYIIDMLSYGVEWDVTVADPACTRIGNMSYHKSLPIQSEYKGCLVKRGKVNYYLDPNDWSKKADGTPSVLDGTDGDVMVHIPKFYGKSGSDGNKRWVRISTIKIDSTWVEVPEMFVSAYRITTFDDSGTSKIASVVNATTNYRGGSNRSDYDQYLSTDKFRTDLGKPRTNVPRATMRANASISGQELLCYEFYKWIFYWAYVIEYANFNSQKEFNSELTSDGYHQGGLGLGLTTFSYSSWKTYNDCCAITPCGYTNEFGNFSGVKTIQIQSPEITLYANRWRGFENPFGDISTNLEGIIIKRDKERANSNVYTTTDMSKYGEDYSLFNIAGVEIGDYGWIKTFNIGSKAEIIPSSVDGSQSTYKCDFIYCNPYSTTKRWLCVGGNASNGAQAGLGFLASDNDLNASNSAVGFRSVVRA